MTFHKILLPFRLCLVLKHWGIKNEVGILVKWGRGGTEKDSKGGKTCTERGLR